jgi:hypothetical protein
MAQEEKKRGIKKKKIRSSISCAGRVARPGHSRPCGRGGLVAAAAAAWVGVAAVPVTVSEVGELWTLSTVAAFVQSPVVLVFPPAGAVQRWPPATAGSASTAVPATVSSTRACPLAAAALVADAPGPLPGGVALRSRGRGRRFVLRS